MSPYFESAENIADLKSVPLRASQPLTETYPSIGPPLSDYIAAPWVCDTQVCLETNVQENPYYTIVMCEENECIQYVVRRMGMQI